MPKLTQLPPADPLAGSEELPLVQGDQMRRAPFNSLNSVNRRQITELGGRWRHDAARALTAGIIQAPQYTNAATRRTIVRDAEQLSIATTLHLGTAVTFDPEDVQPGRELRFDARVNAADGVDNGIGLLIVSAAKADAARADDTNLTFTTAAASPDSSWFILRRDGQIVCYVHTAQGNFLTANQARLKAIWKATDATFAIGEVIRVAITLPAGTDNGDRRISWFRQAGDAFTLIATADIAAAYWPATHEPCAAALDAGTAINWTLIERTATIPERTRYNGKATPERRRFVSHSAAIGGSGEAPAEPFASIADIASAIDEDGDRLRVVVRGGGIYRLVGSLNFAHDRFRRVEIIGDGGDAPDIRLSRVAGVWVQDTNQPTVWETTNYWAGLAVGTNGGVVICYDTTEILALDTPFAKRRQFDRASNDTSPAALAAIGHPASCLVTATGKVRIALPGGENPNDLQTKLELTQRDRILEFEGPKDGAFLRRPECILKNLRMTGGSVNVARASLWDVRWSEVTAAAADAVNVEFRECAGVVHRLKAIGARNDLVQSNHYSWNGLTSSYSQDQRPTIYLEDPLLAGCGYGVDGDCLASHTNGGRFIVRGGIAADAAKFCIGMQDDFEVYGTRAIRGVMGGIIVAPPADVSQRFVLESCTVVDCGSKTPGLAGIEVQRIAGSNTVDGTITRSIITYPGGIIRRGIRITNAEAGTAAKIRLTIENPRFDTAIAEADRRVGFELATVTERALVG